MNILWIEDAGKKNLNQLKQDCFDGSGLFENDENKLFIVDSIDDAFGKIGNGDLDYDFYVIDLDLTQFSMDEKSESLKKNIDRNLSNDEFKKKAGHVMYLKLLEKGVQTNRIVFLTGNATGNIIQNSYRQLKEALYNGEDDRADKLLSDLTDDKSLAEFKDDFENHITNGDFGEADEVIKLVSSDHYDKSDNTFGELIEIARKAWMPNYPEAFKKDDVESFLLWLKQTLTKQNPDFAYLALRRGIIDGCEFLVKELEEKKKDKEYIIFNKTVKGRGLSAKYLISYFQKLKSYLPKNPPTEKEKYRLYYQFLKELSAEWERSEGYLLDKENIDRGWVKNYLDTCQKQMKLLRNWTSHELLSNEVDEAFVSYMFITAMRAILKLDLSKTLEYEDYLGKLFEVEKNPFKGIKKHLAQSYFAIRNVPEFKFRNPDNIAFSTIVRNYGWYIDNNQTIQNKSVKLFYQMFWHGIFPCFMSMPSPNQRDRSDSVPAFIKFNDNKKPPPESFPYTLAQMIYRRSFK
ncbi:MAG: hypothetical protein H8E71_00605 [Candidatus Marinimicrobia bacterium]|nr:hypothetical protein [Candidatus Neomarinimicrobiota bacterium]